MSGCVVKRSFEFWNYRIHFWIHLAHAPFLNSNHLIQCGLWQFVSGSARRVEHWSLSITKSVTIKYLCLHFYFFWSLKQECVIVLHEVMILGVCITKNLAMDLVYIFNSLNKYCVQCAFAIHNNQRLYIDLLHMTLKRSISRTTFKVPTFIKDWADQG